MATPKSSSTSLSKFAVKIFVVKSKFIENKLHPKKKLSFMKKGNRQRVEPKALDMNTLIVRSVDLSINLL